MVRKLVKVLAALVALGLVVAIGATVLVRVSAGPYLHDDAAAVEAPLAIVPGASVYRDGTPSPQLEARLAAALSLLRARRVQRILVSGARHGGYDEAAAMRRWLIRHGVSSDAVTADHAGFRTRDTMRRAAQVFGASRAVVCTQRYHLARAVFLARRAGIDAAGLATGSAYGPGRVTDYLRELLASVRAVADTYLF
jgi:SanA protein